MEEAVLVCAAEGLLGGGVVQVSQLQLAFHHHKLPWLEVQQGHGAQRGLGKIVQQPHKTKAHLRGGGVTGGQEKKERREEKKREERKVQAVL